MRQAIESLLALAALAGLTGAASAQPAAGPKGAGSPEALVAYTEVREPCAERSTNRNAYFGDLHIHTGFSYDARPFGTTTTPADAYRFARGGSIAIPPYDAGGTPQGNLRLKTPLDFAAVTDHSEFFGEFGLCSDPSSPVYDQKACRLFRGGGPEGMQLFIGSLLTRSGSQLEAICGADPATCAGAAASVWGVTRDMAEQAYDRSSRCAFTTFIGYEHTGTPDSNNYHRNVIFRNGVVPDRAISYLDTPRDIELWTALADQCLDKLDGCDVLVIPHNSNLSSGAMFPSYAAGAETTASAKEAARLRAAMEPVMEVFQHKGNSECLNGLPGIVGAPDELCNFEQLRVTGERRDMFGVSSMVRFCREGEIGRRGFTLTGCISRNDFFRSVLLTGLQDEMALGINPYKFGAIGSTDSHLGLAGATDEASWTGHLVDEAELKGRLRAGFITPRSLEANPGGLAGVWAVENSRDALFQAIRRREVFGTSGTRIQPRLFGGWDIDRKACALADLPAHGYANGVPMGSDFRPGASRQKPRLLASAVKDPDGAPLQKLQVIKGWVDAEGQARYSVLDVATARETGATVDLKTGKRRGGGASSLCAVYEDIAFNPAEPAYYYLRVVEVPTLRWSWAQCLALPADERPTACSNDAPKAIQEMAWTSPIWYLPPAAN
jgi:hypothetical protein